MSWFTVDNTAIRPQIFQPFDYISSEFPTVVWLQDVKRSKKEEYIKVDKIKIVEGVAVTSS